MAKICSVLMNLSQIKLSKVYGTEGRKIGLWERTFRKGCQKSILFVKKNILGLTNFWRKLKIFSEINKKILQVVQKIFGKVVKTAFRIFRGTCREKKISIHSFFGLWAKKFQTLSKNFCQGCQTCILRV